MPGAAFAGPDECGNVVSGIYLYVCCYSVVTWLAACKTLVSKQAKALGARSTELVRLSVVSWSSELTLHRRSDLLGQNSSAATEAIVLSDI